MLGHVRDANPVPVQVTGRQPPDPRKRLFLHFSVATVVDFRQLRKIKTEPALPGASSVCATAHHGFNEGRNIFPDDTTLAAAPCNASEIDTEFACKASYGWAGVRNFGRIQSSNARTWLNLRFLRCLGLRWCIFGRNLFGFIGRRCFRDRRLDRCSLFSRTVAIFCRIGHFKHRHDIAFGHRIIEFDLQFPDDTCRRRRNFHGRLVAFQRYQRVLRPHLVTC